MAGLVSRPLTLLSRPLSLLASAGASAGASTGASTGASAGGVNGTATGASAGASAGAPAPRLPPRWAAAWGPLAARRAYGTGPPTPGHGTAVAEEQEEQQQQEQQQEEQQEEEVSGVLRRDDEGTLEVLWHGGARRRYPYVWLRDNCVCPDCFLPSAQARRSAMARLDPNTGVAEVAVANSGQGVSVVWPDGHRSDFSGPWLAARCFSAASRAATQEAIFMEERDLWGREPSAATLPTFPFEAVLSDVAARHSWLAALRRRGVALLHSAPARRGQLQRLAHSVGFLRTTFYGNVWEVRDKSDANNVAYTAGSLPPHTDYPALAHPPGVQFLHCVRQALRGGSSQLVDGFWVCEQLRREQPAAFRLLTSTPLNFVDVGADQWDFHVHSRNPVIQLDEQGRVSRLNLNHATRDSVLDVPLSAVRPLYTALSLFTALTESPRNQITFTLRPGDVITFDNWRVLHGRADYVDPARDSRRSAAAEEEEAGTGAGPGDATDDAGDAGGRLLEGCYLDWDVVLSTLRLLRAGQEKKTRPSASAGRLPPGGGPVGTLG